ncbi:MAG: hypothetical protein ACYS8Z_02930 [Planctomycetota bacterium]
MQKISVVPVASVMAKPEGLWQSIDLRTQKPPQIRPNHVVGVCYTT